MNRAIVCSASRLASLWGHSTVGERHAVGRAIGLALVAVLVVDGIVLWLAALDLVVRNRAIHNVFTVKTPRPAVHQLS